MRQNRALLTACCIDMSAGAFSAQVQAFRTIKMGGVSLWDLTVAYPVTSHLTVRGKIANLFDKDYETVYGYQTAGREYTLSGSYTF